ncbi:MAG: TolC family protein [Desulfobulbaceae bacterium]
MRIHRFALPALALALGLWWGTLTQARAAASAEFSTGTVLTMDQALELAARNRHELASLRADQTAADVRLRHAGLPPNPELVVEWDNLGNDLPGDETRETTYLLSQPFELGGKRSARIDRGRAELLRLRHEQTATWLDIAAEVRAAFIEVLAARERLHLQQEAEQIARDLAAITRERVAAGELPVTEEIRAEARIALTGAETLRSRRLLEQAELSFNAALADPGAMARSADGLLPREVAIPKREALPVRLQEAPLLALRRGETSLATAEVALAKANAWVDPAVSFGVRTLAEQDGHALVLGFSVPLPLFQRNQSELATADATARKAAIREEAATTRLGLELRKAHAELIAADREAKSLRDEVLRPATEAAAAVQEGFRAGKFRYSDVLEASESLLAIKARHLNALIDLNLAAIALDRLLGEPALPAELRFTSSSPDRSDT